MNPLSDVIVVHLIKSRCKINFLSLLTFLLYFKGYNKKNKLDFLTVFVLKIRVTLPTQEILKNKIDRIVKLLLNRKC